MHLTHRAASLGGVLNLCGERFPIQGYKEKDHNNVLQRMDSERTKHEDICCFKSSSLVSTRSKIHMGFVFRVAPGFLKLCR